MSRHIGANIGEIAPYVLISGDPLRTEHMAHRFLTNPRLVSRVRNNLIFTGTYQNVPITLASSGMGMASLAIYAQELFVDYHVQAMIRVGSTGAYAQQLQLHDLVLVKRAHSDFAIWPEVTTNLVIGADPHLNAVISKTAKQPLPLIDVHSTVRFYSQDFQKVRDQYLKKGVATVEMESYALFALGSKFKRATACLLTVSDVLYPPTDPAQRICITNDEIVTGFVAMFQLGLDSLVAFSKITKTTTN